MMWRELQQLVLKTTQWRDGILVDMCSALMEAICVLIISSLSIMVLSIQYGLDNVGVGFLEAFFTTIFSTLHPTEVIIYVTGILSSTTAYFLVRIRFMRPYIGRLIGIFLVTFAIFFFATPLYISGLESAPQNEDFAATLAAVLGVLALAVWTFSLFSQRRIFERGSIPFSGDLRGREIAENIEST